MIHLILLTGGRKQTTQIFNVTSLMRMVGGRKISTRKKLHVFVYSVCETDKKCSMNKAHPFY